MARLTVTFLTLVTCANGLRSGIARTLWRSQAHRQAVSNYEVAMDSAAAADGQLHEVSVQAAVQFEHVWSPEAPVIALGSRLDNVARAKSMRMQETVPIHDANDEISPRAAPLVAAIDTLARKHWRAQLLLFLLMRPSINAGHAAAVGQHKKPE